ncbi:EamA family transporter [Legionella jordanis]|uniref:Integral membrane protein n=1 Tax=Legionella jordanis TaxID=456 RepID=A0A0W0VB02_9GAMM|nr:EamA family transporter [Legionella jordanis]KTD17299.1 integral membrane protein [Legionella jordanis]RMW99458.1 O-acetylserine/cysteine exporter [Legionella jordanis]RMX15307.1 O-acetylserine/cysteine exporter [Legionella jordanis]VEH12502.1 integral membrane protein [Legionella jordanis]HAT8715228.1 EamA family transporter [Legionella jordanis]
MPVSHILLALLVAIVWGINFLFVKLGLEEIPPLLLCTLRFTLASIPAIFFIKPPATSFKLVASYGLFMFALQFSLMFLGMHAGMTPGMASLLIQVQVFFSMFFAAIILKEQPNPWQIVGALVSFMGIAVVAFHLDQHISLAGFILILASAATWGFGNLMTKKAKNVNMMALVVWGSFVAVFPMLILSLSFEGLHTIEESLSNLSWRGGSSLLYIVYISTWVGYGVWNWLVSRYPVGAVVPFTLLVPVVGIISSILILGESFHLWKLVACLFVLGGLCINILSVRVLAVRGRKLLQEECSG